MPHLTCRSRSDSMSAKRFLLCGCQKSRERERCMHCIHWRTDSCTKARTTLSAYVV